MTISNRLPSSPALKRPSFMSGLSESDNVKSATTLRVHIRFDLCIQRRVDRGRVTLGLPKPSLNSLASSSRCAKCRVLTLSSFALACRRLEHGSSPAHTSQTGEDKSPHKENSAFSSWSTMASVRSNFLTMGPLWTAPTRTSQTWRRLPVWSHGARARTHTCALGHDQQGQACH